MQNFFENFKILPKKEKITIISVASLAVLGVVAIIVGAVLNAYYTPSNYVKVSDYDDLPVSVPQDIREDLSLQLYYLLSRNFDVPEQPGATVATIRPDSYQNSSASDSIISISFIADVDRFQQSYNIGLSWSTDGKKLPENVSTECVINSLSKYQGVECYGTYQNSNSIELYVPYSNYTPSGGFFTVRQRYYTNGEGYLEIAIDSCGNQAILDEALASAKTWLESNSLNPDDYSFELPTHYCAN